MIHDEQCPYRPGDALDPHACACALIARVRADLRARIDATPGPVEDGSSFADGWYDALNMVSTLIDGRSDE